MSAQDQIQAVEDKIASQGAHVAEKASETPSPAPVAPISGETEAADELVDTASTEVAVPRKPNKVPARERISELYGQTKEAERALEAERTEKEYWRQQALKNQAGEKTPTPAESTEKTLADFDFDQSKYDRYIGRQEAKAELQAEAAERKKAADQAKIAEREKTFHDRIAKFEAAHPDVDFVADVIQAAIPISDPMADFIKESDVGPELGMYFKDHPEEAKSIFDMTPSQSARAMAKLEVKLSAAEPAIPAQPVQITSAPPAPPRLNASSAGRSTSEGVQAEIAAVRAQRNR